MNRDGVIVAILWVVMTAIGEWIALTARFMPMVGAEEAAVIDEAFTLLLVLAVPVATLVLAFFFYSILRFRAKDGEETQEGPPVRGNNALAILWVLGSLILAVYIVFNPGLKGIRELEASKGQEELVIQIEGVQWHWNVSYPDYDLSYERALQIALPVDTRVRFDITSQDVLHSVWVPAFRMKMDAVPGRVTTLYVTPTEVGDFSVDPNLRVQCAELCGTGHPLMRMDVRVLEPEEFQEWIQEAKEMVMGSGMEGMDMSGQDMSGQEMSGEMSGDMPGDMSGEKSGESSSDSQ